MKKKLSEIEVKRLHKRVTEKIKKGEDELKESLSICMQKFFDKNNTKNDICIHAIYTVPNIFADMLASNVHCLKKMMAKEPLIDADTDPKIIREIIANTKKMVKHLIEYLEEESKNGK